MTRELVFDAIIREPDVTREEAIAWATHHFDEQDGVVIDRVDESFSFGRVDEIRVSGRAFRRHR